MRRTPIHRALVRPHLLLGGERELVLVTIIIAVGLSVTSQNLVAAVVSLLIWLVVMAAIRWMASVDPLLSKVYLRSLRFKPYYPARSRPSRIDQRCPDNAKSKGI